jgi:hypothetical protein
MKKQLLTLLFLALVLMAFGQSPSAFQYQAVARDPAGTILSNKNVSYRLSIQQGTVTGAIVYSERHYTATNEFGLVTLEIGKGAADTGTLSGIHWGVDQHFLKVELDPGGGDNFQLMGSSQLLSVPYALHANTVERGDDWGLQTIVTDLTLKGSGTPASPLGLAQQGAETGQVMKWSGSSWGPAADNLGTNYWNLDAGNLYYLTGKVGIGTSTPTQQLTLFGRTFTQLQCITSTSGSTNTDGLMVGLSDDGSWLWNYENAELYFGTNNTKRMIISAGGDVSLTGNLFMSAAKKIGIGTTIPAFTLDIAGPANLNKTDAVGPALYVHGDEALYYNGTYFRWGLGCTYNYFYHAVNIGTSTSPGTHLLVVNGTAAKPGGGSWVTWSDARLKDVLGDYDKGLEEIAALKPVRFTYREDNPLNLPADNEFAGFIAQDVRTIFPEAVGEGEDGYLYFDANSVNVAMVNAIRELKAENDRLRAGLKKMNDRLSRLESLIAAESKKQ